MLLSDSSAQPTYIIYHRIFDKSIQALVAPKDFCHEGGALRFLHRSAQASRAMGKKPAVGHTTSHRVQRFMKSYIGRSEFGGELGHFHGAYVCGERDE